jgi:hypothetical protein
MNRTGKTCLVTVLGDAMMIGTPDYLPPEQAIDFHAADIRSDIYSLGCTLHYLLVGQPPFPGGSLPTKLIRHQQEEPPDAHQLRPEVPAELAGYLRQLLAKEPRDRPQKPAEVAEALEPWTRSSTAISAKRPTKVATLRPGKKTEAPGSPDPATVVRRRRWLPIATSVLCMSMGFLGLILLTGSSQPGPSSRSAKLTSPSHGSSPAQAPAVDPARTVVLLPQSAPGWRFLPAAAVADVGEGWRAGDFNDAGWRTGQAPLGHGGTTEMREITNRGGTTIPEKGEPFVPASVLLQPGFILRLHVASDNCATVWINGEIADEEKANRDFKYWNRQVEVPLKLLKPGRNVMAALVTNNRGSSDIFWDVELTAGPPQ